MAIQAHMDTAHTDLNIMKAEYSPEKPLGGAWRFRGRF